MQRKFAVFDENFSSKAGMQDRHGAASAARSREVFGTMQRAPCSISASDCAGRHRAELAPAAR
jgi:hypothetical protein